MKNKKSPAGKRILPAGLLIFQGGSG